VTVACWPLSEPQRSPAPIVAVPSTRAVTTPSNEAPDGVNSLCGRGMLPSRSRGELLAVLFRCCCSCTGQRARAKGLCKESLDDFQGPTFPRVQAISKPPMKYQSATSRPLVLRTGAARSSCGHPLPLVWGRIVDVRCQRSLARSDLLPVQQSLWMDCDQCPQMHSCSSLSNTFTHLIYSTRYTTQ
jgi:hypothetical protein